MRTLELQRVGHGRHVWATLADDAADRPRNPVNRQFTATRPNQLWVADFTFVSTWSGMVLAGFVIGVFARCIVGWRVACSMRTDLVLDTLEQAFWSREVPHGLVHHSDRGSEHSSIRNPG